MSARSERPVVAEFVWPLISGAELWSMAEPPAHQESSVDMPYLSSWLPTRASLTG